MDLRLALSLCCLGAGLSGQVAFAPGRVETALSPHAQFVDVDADGIVDFASASKSQLVVKFGVGDGTFGAATALPERAGPFTFADFDGDEVLDLVHANPTPGPQRLFFSKGLGDVTFAAPVDLSLPGTLLPGSPTPLDFDADGDLDFVYASQIAISPSFLHAIRNDGAAGFELVYTATAGGFGSTPVWVADLDLDGFDDIVFRGTSGTGYALATGTGSFDAPRALPMTIDDVGDLIGDGRPEVVAREDGDEGQRLIAYTFVGDAFVESASFDLPATFVTAFSVADVDADGRAELLSTPDLGGIFGVVLRPSDGDELAVVGHYQSAGGPRLTTSDFDGDGRPDLASFPIVPLDPAVLSQNATPAPGGPLLDLGGALQAAGAPPVGDTVPLAAYSVVPGAGQALAVSIGGAPVGADGFLVVGLSNLSQPLGGGVLIPSPDAVIRPFVVPPIQIGEQFALSIEDLDLLGLEVFVQWWFVDDGGLSATSGLRIAR